MRRFIRPLIHDFKLNGDVVKPTWGFSSQARNKELRKQNISSTSITYPASYNPQLHPKFQEGSTLAYRAVFNACRGKEDFLDGVLTSPKLSVALNYLNTLKIERDESWELEYSEVAPEVLGTWVEEGIARANSHVLGSLILFF
jgi:hypothetical protein